MLRGLQLQLLLFTTTNPNYTMKNLLHYQNVSHYQKVKKTTEVLIILICSQKIKVYCLRKLIACVQIAERSASAGNSYSQVQIQILLQKIISMM